MKAPLILDLDNSTDALPDACVLPLEHWQEAIRFGCSQRTLRRFVGQIRPALERPHGTVFLGSGDFHHLSWPLVQFVAERSRQRLQVVVLDNHPDNMRYPFGVHCGSWVRHAAALAQVAQVHVVGICSSDAGTTHCWEQYLAPLRAGRLHLWCLGVDTRWARLLGCAGTVHGFDDIPTLLATFAARHDAHRPTYLSIDKDVFAEDVARTNWDQGRFQLADAQTLISGLTGPIIGSDITGEISDYRYRSPFKRMLSALDGQQQPDPLALPAWQAGQHVLNLELLQMLQAR